MEEVKIPDREMDQPAVPDASEIEVAPPGPSPEAVAPPKPTGKKKPLPKPKTEVPPVPKVEKPENCVTINGVQVEIKPTKFKYFRNRTASIYTVLKIVPINEFLTYQRGTFDEARDSDQILFDFLVAVFDDAQFVKLNYDNLTADDFERILEIFGRINHIDEKEERARKNREAQAMR